MTKISVNVFKDTFNGKVPISYRVTARPVVRQIVDGSIITRNAKTYEGLMASTFELTPTKLGEAWMISILASNDDEVSGYYKVPDVEEILFTELIAVDPETLEPDAEPEPEWWAVSKATVQGGVVDANGDLILTRSDGVKINAGHVQGEPGVDGVSIPGSPGKPGAPGVGFVDAELDVNGDLNLIQTTGDIINVGHVAGEDGVSVVGTAIDANGDLLVTLSDGQLVNAGKVSPYTYNVKNFGAKGDGVTDDTLAIQSAIDASRGKTLIFPSGQYSITGDNKLSIPSDIKLLGEPGAVIDLSNRSGWDNTSVPEGFIIMGQGELGTENVVTVDIDSGSTAINVTSTSGLSSGDIILLTSDATWPGDVSPAKVGELIKILKVESETLLTLGAATHEPYLISDNAKIQRVDPIKNVTIQGIKFVGKGAPSLEESPTGQLGVGIFYGENVTIRDCEFNGLDQISLEICGVYQYRIENCIFESDKVPDGWSYPYVQYQCRVSSPSIYGVIDGVSGVSGRHTVSTGHYSSFPGIVRHLTVTNCFARGSWHAAFSTHNDSEFVVFDGNTAVNCVYGINPRDRNTVITNNTIIGSQHGILLYGYVKSLTIRGNSIVDTVGTAIYMDESQMADNYLFDDLIIEDNFINGSIAGIYLRNTTNNLLKRGLSISGNTIMNIGDGSNFRHNAIRLNAAFSGKIYGNNIRNIKGHAIYLEGMARYLQVRGNILENFTTGVQIVSTVTQTTVRENTFAHYSGVAIQTSAGVGVDAVISNNVDYGSSPIN